MVGNALDLAAPDRSFDAVRSERTLQWLTDPNAAVAEMARVLRLGGLLALIDSDPVFTQIKLARGQRDFRAVVNAHDVHFSFGECLTDRVPDTGHRWLPTRHRRSRKGRRRADGPVTAATTSLRWTARFGTAGHTAAASSRAGRGRPASP